MKEQAGRQVAIVTGASHGIGHHIARVLTGRTASELDDLRTDLEARGTRAAAVAADLTDAAGPATVVAAAMAAFGRIDVLVNNAGGDPIREFHAMSWEENRAILAL